MNKEFKLPDVGEGLTEADIVSWHVKPGDTVQINQVIVEIETAKAVVELPSPVRGDGHRPAAAEGETVDVGTPIISVDVPGADGGPGQAPGAAGRRRARRPPAAPGKRSSSATAPSRERRPAARASPRRHARRPRRLPAPSRPTATARRPRHRSGRRHSGRAVGRCPRSAGALRAGRRLGGRVVPSVGGSPGGRPPGGSTGQAPVRRLARDLGVDLTALAGSGPEGSVTREDVRAGRGRNHRPFWIRIRGSR